MNSTAASATFPVGLEEGPDGATLVHSLTLPGCVASGPDRESALRAFETELIVWLQLLAAIGEPTPPAGTELEIAVDEWFTTDSDVASGESTVCFEADRAPLTDGDIVTAMRRLGDLRGALLARTRRAPDAELDRAAPGGATVRQVLEELARAQWWTLSRLGATPLGELPDRTLGRLDTAMALVVHTFSTLPSDARDRTLEIDGEEWTPRKVLRRLLWLEWTLGRVARATLRAGETGDSR